MRIIDLNVNGTEHFDNIDKILQGEAFEKLDTILQAQIHSLENPGFQPPTGKELSYSRQHNSILIEGGRGSGKTTFLLNALHYLEEKSQCSSSSWFKGIPSKVQVLPSIDPTLIETKEHIIIVIISLIDAALDDDKNNPDTDRTAVNESRRKMAEGLGLLDGIGKAKPYGDEWEDPEWIMSRGLRKARNGRSFEIKFQTYIYEALKILNKKAFILAFDDVDTNFQHGYKILETMRKYLTSPQLILLISGDLELYGRLVRRNIYENFGEKIMDYDPNIIGKEKTEIFSTVQELEEQYLLKIVPPQNRISMLSLGEIIQIDHSKDIMVIPTGMSEQEPLRNWASKNIHNKLLEPFYLQEKNPTYHPFLEFISREHLRLVISYLRAIGDKDPINARRGVFSVFDTRLRLAGINSLQLAHATHNSALLLTFRWLITQDKPTYLARFGVPSDADKAIILHCFALAISKELKGSPDQCLRTLLTFNLPISMMQGAIYANSIARTAILEFIWDDASPDLFEVAGRIGSIARLNTNEHSNRVGYLEASCFGSVGTKKKEERTEILHRMFDVPKNRISENIKTVSDLQNIIKGKIDAFSAQNWIATLLKNPQMDNIAAQKNVIWFTLEDLTNRCGNFNALLRFITYERYSSRGEKFKSVSAISLLATISIILDTKNNKKKYEVSPIIPAFLPNTNNILTIDQSEMEESDLFSSISEYEESNSIETTEKTDYPDYIEQMNAWVIFARQFIVDTKQSHPENTETSISELARIAERIHDQLLSLDEEVSPKWKTGHILHRQITNILHAILVTTSGSSSRIDSPKSSDRSLVEALRRAADVDNKNYIFHPLAAIVLSCPLVWAFLNPNEAYKTSGTTTITLRNEATAALKVFQTNYGTAETPFDPAWLSPPKIPVVIGILNAKHPHRIIQEGFFDLLNVVPRYYPNVGSTK